MSNQICLSGEVTKIVTRDRNTCNGCMIVMHVTSAEKTGWIWFTVRIEGRAAAYVFGDIEPGDRVTVFGNIWPQQDPIAGNIYVRASTVEVHSFDGGSVE